MKIGIIYYKFMQGGGQERYVFYLVQEFLRLGHEIHLIAARRGDDQLPVHFHPVPVIPYPHSLRMLTFAFRSKKIAQQLDLDITYGLGKTFFQDVWHGGVHRVYLRQSGQMGRVWRTPKNWAALYLEKRLCHGGETRCFVVNSKLVKDQMVQCYGVDPQKIEIVYMGVDADRFNPAQAAKFRERLRADHGLTPEDRAFLFVSFDHPRKGLEPLLRAFPRAKGKLFIVGRPLNSFFKNLVAELRLQDRVVDVGPQDNVVPWFGLADFTVLPSFYDTFGYVVLESLACGKPVIVSAQTGAFELIEEGTDGFVLREAGDVAVLEHIFERVNSLGETELRRMREAAAAKGRQFEDAEHVRHLIALFDRLRTATAA